MVSPETYCMSEYEKRLQQYDKAYPCMPLLKRQPFSHSTGVIDEYSSDYNCTQGTGDDGESRDYRSDASNPVQHESTTKAVKRSRFFIPELNDMNDFQRWLNEWRPSTLQRHPEGIKYIIVLSPERCHGNLTPADPMGLLKAWEDFKLSGCTTNEDAIREMARTYNVFGGKWMLYPSSPVKADKFWSIIAPAVVNGELTTSCVGAKVMPLGYNNRPTVCVYMNDSTDIDKIEELERAIRVLKFRCLMYFKADVKSQLGIFGTNCHDYNVCCQSYRSRFIAWMGKSVITQRCPVSHSWLPESIGQSEHAAYQLQNSLYYMNWLPAAFTYHANARQSLLKTDNHHDNNPYRYCHVCGEPNHVTEECKHPKPVWCHSCKRIGHKAKFCYMYY